MRAIDMPQPPEDPAEIEPVGDDLNEPAPDDVELIEVEPGPNLPTDDGYAPYDLTQVRPNVAFDPTPDDGGLVLGPLTNDAGEALPAFDPKYREDFYGLLHLGALSKTFGWLGHKFLIRTITVHEALQVGLLVKEYSDSMGEMLAYRTAMAAMSVQQVDSKDLPIPIGDTDDYAYAKARFEFASKRWFQFTVDAIYNEYLVLETRTREVVDAMGKAYGPEASMTG